MPHNYDEFYWEKLDNAAKIYPSVTSKKATNVYRMSAKLVESVQPEILQEALEKTIVEVPSFNMKMRKGFFWYYFEKNFQQPKVLEDNLYPCTRIDKFSNNGFLFRVTYFGKMVNLEVFHVLTDGFGAIHFFKTLLLYYFKHLYPDRVPDDLRIESDDLTGNEMVSDSFLRHYREAEIPGKPYRPQAYRIKGVPVFGWELKIIQGIVSTKEILAVSKKYNTTATIYLASVLMYAIYRESFQHNMKDRPIEISVPVNLRSYFESTTMRNFFSYVSTGINFYENDMTFEEVVAFVTQDLKEKLKKETLAAKIKYNVGAQQNLFLRAIPLVIKDIALKIIYKISEKSLTSTITNVGRITVPKEIEDFIERFSVMVWVNTVQMKKIAVCSYRDAFVVTFTSGIEETSIEQRFFKILNQDGLNVTINANYPEVPTSREGRRGKNKEGKTDENL